MNMISWSAELRTAVKNFKQLDTKALQSRLNNRTFMNSLALSASEEQALTSTFQNKNHTKLEADWG